MKLRNYIEEIIDKDNETIDIYLVDTVFVDNSNSIVNLESKINVLCIKVDDYFVDIINNSKKYYNLNNQHIDADKNDLSIFEKIRNFAIRFRKTEEYVNNIEIQCLAQFANNDEILKKELEEEAYLENGTNNNILINNENISCKMLEFPKKGR